MFLIKTYSHRIISANAKLDLLAYQVAMDKDNLVVTVNQVVTANQVFQVEME